MTMMVGLIKKVGRVWNPPTVKPPKPGLYAATINPLDEESISKKYWNGNTWCCKESHSELSINAYWHH